jgi:hypothetical protein
MENVLQDNMIKSLTCPICNNLFINPMISGCCSRSFCASCVGNSSKCPVCKKISGFIFNSAVNDMISLLPFKCVCGLILYRKDRTDHNLVCESVIRNCRKCNFTGNLAERVDHMLDSHADIIISNYSEIV